MQYIELYDKAIDLSLVQRADNLNLVLPYTHGQSCFVNLAECVYSKSYRIIIAREELASHYCLWFIKYMKGFFMVVVVYDIGGTNLRSAFFQEEMITDIRRYKTPNYFCMEEDEIKQSIFSIPSMFSSFLVLSRYYGISLPWLYSNIWSGKS